MSRTSRLRSDFLAPERPSADGATIACIFAVALLVVPARLVLRGIPLSLTPAEFIGLAMAFWWICAQLTTTVGAAKGRNPVRTAVFCYVTAALANFGYATYRYLPEDELRLADHAVILVAAYFGATLVVCDGVCDRRRLDVLLKAVVGAGTAVALVGALQFLFALDLTKYLALPGLRMTFDYSFVDERAAFRRVAGTTGHAIEFGVVCAMVLPVAVHYAARARAIGARSLRWWLCAAALGSGLLFSISRSAILGVAGVALVLFLGWSGRRRVRAVMAGFGFLVVIWLSVPGLLGTFVGLFAGLRTDSSIQFRTHDYDAVQTQLSDSFWLGRGLGTWYAPKHQIFDNQYLLTLVETGFIGLVVFAGVFVTAIVAALRARAHAVDHDMRDLGLTIAACLAVPFIGSATFDLLSFHAVTGLSFLMVGAAGAAWRISRAERNQLMPGAARG